MHNKKTRNCDAQDNWCPAERNIGSILLNLMNMMDHVNKKKMESLILLVDFKKAFDSINTKFINSAQTIFNFGSSFRNGVKLFL
jgi:hypothetical protein